MPVPNDLFGLTHLNLPCLRGDVLADKLWVNNMTSVESKVEQVPANGKEEEREGARGCRQEETPGVARARARLCGSECVGYITGRMPSSLSLALIVVVTTRSSSTPLSLPRSVTFRCAVRTDLHAMSIGRVSDNKLQTFQGEIRVCPVWVN